MWVFPQLNILPSLPAASWNWMGPISLHHRCLEWYISSQMHTLGLQVVENIESIGKNEERIFQGLFGGIVQFSSVTQSCPTLRPHESQHARPSCPSPTPGVHWDSRPSSQWCHPAISSSVVPFSSCPNPSQHQSFFQWVNSSHEVAKVLEFQLQHHSSKEIPGLISFRMDWLDLLAVQGTLKSLLQHHSSNNVVLNVFLTFESTMFKQATWLGHLLGKPLVM